MLRASLECSFCPPLILFSRSRAQSSLLHHHRRIEEKRGVTVSETGGAEVKNSLGDVGLSSQVFASSMGTIPVSAAPKNVPAWDDDWGLPKGRSRPALHNSATNAAPVPMSPPLSSSVSQPIHVPSLQTLSCSIPSAASVVSSQQSVTVTCSPVSDIEWPPRASSAPTLQSHVAKKQQPTAMMAGPALTQSFDDIDPFADWPPRPANGSLGVAGASNGNAASAAAINSRQGVGASKTSYNNEMFPVNSNNNWTFSSSYQGNSGLVGTSSQSSIGYSRQNQGSSTLHGHAETRSADIGSIFASSKNEQAAAPRLAPPPSTAVGRGRGRGAHGQSSTSRTGTRKPPSEQPPLLDLL